MRAGLALSAAALLATTGCGVTVRFVRVLPPERPRQADVEVRFAAPLDATVSDVAGFCGRWSKHTFAHVPAGTTLYDASEMALGAPPRGDFHALSVYLPTELGERAAVLVVYVPSFQPRRTYAAGPELRAALLVGGTTESSVSLATAEQKYVMTAGTVTVDGNLRGTVAGEFTPQDHSARAVTATGSFECVATAA